MYTSSNVVAVMFIFLSPLLFFSHTSDAHASCLHDTDTYQLDAVWPAVGQIEQGWSLTCSTDRGHRGVDIGLKPGEEVRATAGGEVVFTGFTPAEGGGGTISIDHPGGLRSTYVHVTDVEIVAGEHVSAGQIIGKSDGRALHFGMKESNGKGYLNPMLTLPDVNTGPEEEAVSVIGTKTPEATSVEMAPPALSPSVNEPGPVPIRGNGLQPKTALVSEPETIAFPDLPSGTEMRTKTVNDEKVTIKNPHQLPDQQRGQSSNWGYPGTINTDTGFQLSFPAVLHAVDIYLIGADANYITADISWLYGERQKCAAAGLLVSTLVLFGIRRQVWVPWKRLEFSTGSSPGD